MLFRKWYAILAADLCSAVFLLPAFPTPHKKVQKVRSLMEIFIHKNKILIGSEGFRLPEDQLLYSNKSFVFHGGVMEIASFYEDPLLLDDLAEEEYVCILQRVLWNNLESFIPTENAELIQIIKNLFYLYSRQQSCSSDCSLEHGCPLYARIREKLNECLSSSTILHDKVIVNSILKSLDAGIVNWLTGC